MRKQFGAFTWLVSSVFVCGVAHADDGVPARCRAALKTTHAYLSKESETKSVYLDIPGGVELQVGYASGDAKATEMRGAGRCLSTEMSLGIGTIPLPSGWLAVDGQGTDSHVGVVLDARDREIMKYDIGAMAGVYASEATGAAPAFTWSKHEEVAGQPLVYVLKKRVLYMTLGQNTNFWGPAATEKEMAPLLAFVRGMKKPSSPPK